MVPQRRVEARGAPRRNATARRLPDAGRIV